MNLKIILCCVLINVQLYTSQGPWPIDKDNSLDSRYRLQDITYFKRLADNWPSSLTDPMPEAKFLKLCCDIAACISDPETGQAPCAGKNFTVDQVLAAQKMARDVWEENKMRLRDPSLTDIEKYDIEQLMKEINKDLRDMGHWLHQFNPGHSKRQEKKNRREEYWRIWREERTKKQE